MKRNVLYSLILGLGFSLMACSDDEPNVTLIIGNGEQPDSGEPKTEKTLKGKITKDTEIPAGEKWLLDGIVVVEKGATLTIGKGVELVANPDDGVDALFINKGAKINAVGTASEPIVMTSTVKERGSFGGLVILGEAPINVAGGTSASELGSDYKYGGDKPNDNSGVLKYVRIEYAGKKNSSDNEFNGFSFYAVGSGTVVENLQAYYGSDDGFEFFGGTVRVKNLISTGNEDDAVDWTEGWTGGGENWLIELADDDGDFGFESSGNDEAPSLQPYSKPIIRNVTIKGGAVSMTEKKSAVRLKSGTNIDIENLVIEGFPKGIRFDKEQSVKFLQDGKMSIKRVRFGANVQTKFVNKSEVEDAEFQKVVAKITEDTAATGANIADKHSWAR